MRTRRALYPQSSEMYMCELEECPVCKGSLSLSEYASGRKIVQTLSSTVEIGYWPKQCDNPECSSFGKKWRSARWQQTAPMHCTYGFDVIASVGWQRQMDCHSFDRIHLDLGGKVVVSESGLRHLYYYRYLPLLASRERSHWKELERVSAESGLILSLDGLAPEGGEPQLWVVRELQTGLTLRSGWLSKQDQTTFENFLSPIAKADLKILAVLSDKQRGLLPAVGTVFPEVGHALCQSHYFKNIAEPATSADETMKVSLRKKVRESAGHLIRPESVENSGVMTVTGLFPSPMEEPSREEAPVEEPTQKERKSIVDALLRRVRYLLTLKGRPPFRMAGVEMVEGLREVCECVEGLIAHLPDERLVQLQQGIKEALDSVAGEYKGLREVANWLARISELLDPEGKPPRGGGEVKRDLFAYLNQLLEQTRENSTLFTFAAGIYKTTSNYAPGLFHTYDVPGLPRTNNDRESEFRNLNRRLLCTTGQRGATRRMIQRCGAWELIPRPGTFSETVAALSLTNTDEFQQERQRIRDHRKRFSLHTRSGKQIRKQLEALKTRWFELPGEKP
jgi:hypothetical protein